MCCDEASEALVFDMGLGPGICDMTLNGRRMIGAESCSLLNHNRYDVLIIIVLTPTLTLNYKQNARVALRTITRCDGEYSTTCFQSRTIWVMQFSNPGAFILNFMQRGKHR